ncbi:MAG TPA: ABC transporter ATP-binding protein [Thermoclostridium caenicola]|uniref:ABC transporter ATP-binding protein n=1 Tax=Thermoclostridium caenicola TaxID=659425 RepID=UPI002C92F264|nr:ABC transporter ATP-binding protein [Thermoclostridium caenicola]HPO76114.1 ABC transporter ATP-binding protein [Thermoclostridium caenicola]
MLDIKGLNVKYGGIHAVRDVSMNVPQGNIVSLIGANGAGKTSILSAICNLVKNTGSITFAGKDITKLSTKAIVEQGITLVPEGRHVFPDLTTYENLVLGAYTRRKDKKSVIKDMDLVYNYFPRLKERESQLAGTLSGGEQQMLAVGRALMSRPKLMMLDEPSMGLAPILVNEIFKIIQRISEEGVTILLIEQNARMALKIADMAYVLETGSIVLSGTGKELLNNDRVQKAYLGA